MEMKPEPACGLDIPPGLHDHPKYTQHFVKAPLSQHPSKAPVKKDEHASHEAMRITLEC